MWRKVASKSSRGPKLNKKAATALWRSDPIIPKHDPLAIRGREIAPRLAGAVFGDAHAGESGLLTANWCMGDAATLRLKANLSNSEIAHKRSEPTGTQIWGGETDDLIPPWSVFWRIGGR